MVKLSENEALIYTLDFITPVVDDPEIFGEIAAANSLSDVYAMGADPWICLNILCFPTCKLPLDYMKLIVKGGLKKIREAEAFLVGGHSVDDLELKYGLSVVGRALLENVKTNSQAKPKDRLYLTKPLGTGIVVTAIKAGMSSKRAQDEAIDVMRTLNKEASRIMVKKNASAATDVTGFGLIGHAVEMAKSSKVDLVIDSTKVPYIEEALEYAEFGLIPAGAYENEKHFGKEVVFKRDIGTLGMVLYDPQTSGGLLISCSCDLPYHEIGYVIEGNGRVIVE